MHICIKGIDKCTNQHIYVYSHNFTHTIVHYTSSYSVVINRTFMFFCPYGW